MTEQPDTPSPALPEPATAEEFTELLPETRRALLHRVAQAQREGRAPSLVAALVRDGEVRWYTARGEVAGARPDGRTQYRIGSLTKTFVALLVLRLRDAGRISLEDRLDSHLATPSGGQATIAQLLSHSAGLTSEARGPWWERTPGELRPELADIFPERPEPHPAGRLHHYSNPGYALLGALVEELHGEHWYSVLRREVLEPLGMTGTTLLPRAPHAEGLAVHPHADAVQDEQVVDTGRMAPAGQLWSTIADLGRFAAFLTEGDERVLGAGSLAEMRRPAVAPQAEDWETSYGLGLQLLRSEGRLLSGHSGSMPGFLTGLWTSPDDRLAAVVLTNTTSGLRAASLAAQLLGLAAEREPAIPEPWRPIAEPDPELVALTGIWYWGTGASELRLGEGRVLTLGSFGSVTGCRFLPEEDGSWTGQGGYFTGERLRLARRPDGTVSHLDIGTFVFTRSPYDPAAPVPGGTHPEGWR